MVTRRRSRGASPKARPPRPKRPVRRDTKPIDPPIVRAMRAARVGNSVQDAILTGVLDPLLIIDGYGRIERASESVQRVFLWKPTELVGRNINVLMPEPYHSEHDGYLAAYRETGKSGLLGKTREFPILRKDGTIIDCEMSVSRVDVPGRSEPLFTGSFRDITERRRAADAAEAAAARERAMLGALATIGESSAILAHEIKNPITAINVALRAVADKLGSKDREVVDDLAARLRKVEAMIRRTLSFAKPVALKLRPITPKALSEEVMKAVAPRVVAAKNVKLKTECRATDRVEVDPDLLGDVMVNLVNNAIEAADGRPVTIRISCHTEGRNHIRIDVADNGPGFPDSVASNAFKPFVTTKETGTGLGLALCKKIIEQHGGTLSIVPVEPHGACLRILLPRYRNS